MLTGASFLDAGQRAVFVDMARPSTIAQFAQCIAGVRVLVLLMRTRFVVIGMTSRTIRLIGWAWPRYGL